MSHIRFVSSWPFWARVFVSIEVAVWIYDTVLGVVEHPTHNLVIRANDLLVMVLLYLSLRRNAS